MWFGYGLFYTNTVESLWGQIKKHCNNFSGLSIEFLQKKFNNNDELIKEYLDGWICYSLFLRDIIRLKLSWSGRVDLLSDYLK